MDQQNDIGLDLADECILTHKVSDEALEAAAGTTRLAPKTIHDPGCCADRR